MCGCRRKIVREGLYTKPPPLEPVSWFLLCGFFFLFVICTVLPAVVLNVTNIYSDSVNLSWTQPNAHNVKKFFIFYIDSYLFMNSSHVPPINTTLFSKLPLLGYTLQGSVPQLRQGVTYLFLVQYEVESSSLLSHQSNMVNATTLTSKPTKM